MPRLLEGRALLLCMESSGLSRDTARAMSQENVEIVLDQWDAWSDGNLDRWAQAWDPEVVVVRPEGLARGRGRAGPRSLEASGSTSAGYLGGGADRG